MVDKQTSKKQTREKDKQTEDRQTRLTNRWHKREKRLADNKTGTTRQRERRQALRQRDKKTSIQ